jgi:hypothetical protein
MGNLFIHTCISIVNKYLNKCFFAKNKLKVNALALQVDINWLMPSDKLCTTLRSYILTKHVFLA